MIELYVVLIILLAFVGEAVFGFGGGLLAVPLLSLVIDVNEAVILTSIFQFLIGFLVFKNLKDIPWKLIPPVLFGLLIGIPIGIFALGYLKIVFLRCLLVFFILSFLIRIKFFPKLSFKKKSLLTGGISGFLSGFFQGCIGIGGPNLVLYFSSIAENKYQFRAALIFMLSVANLIRIVLMGASYSFTKPILYYASISMPLFILGIVLGQKFFKVIPEKIYFLCSYALLIFSVIALIFKINISIS